MPPSTVDSASATPHPELDVSAIPGRWFALFALFSMNMLNYIDRYSFFAVGTHIQNELKISNSRFGILSASFMIVYTIVSPLMGFLGDRYSRKRLLAAGVGLWSFATVGTAFSYGFSDMFFWRALLGVGEASYGVIAPALLADLFHPKYRGRVIGFYFLALPLGGAVGYGIGGVVADALHWRAAFWVVGLPGIVAAFAALMIRDPGRGASEGHVATGEASRPDLNDYLSLFRNKTFLLNTAGMAAVTFVTGAYAAWGSTFYQTVRGMTASQAGVTIGGLTALAGLIGIFMGSWLADLLLKVTKRAYLLTAGLAVMIAIVPGLMAMLEPNLPTSFSLLIVAMILMASVLGPCNTTTANVVPANRRSSGYALSIFLIHVFGDILSPILIGFIADFFGEKAVAASAVGQWFAKMGANPINGTNLTVGMLSVVPVMALGCLFFFLGSRYLPEDQERALAAGGGGHSGPSFGH